MRIGIMQPGYLPWLGYFEQMSRCDIFVHCDTVQYTHQDWRNRNRIKAKNGIDWLTIPIGSGHKMKLRNVQIKNKESWSRKHIGAIRMNYGKAKFFHTYFNELAEILKSGWIYLVDLDIALIEWISERLGIKTKVVRSSMLGSISDDKQLRGIEICKALGCDEFYEGQKGQDYINTNLFAEHGIKVEFQKYNHPYYNQKWCDEQGFISHLSIIDLLFNHGPDSLAILINDKIIIPPDEMIIRNVNDI